MNALVSTITRENKEVFLMGDYNIDMTKTDTHPLKLINTLASYSFHSHINNRTSIADTSRTLLDNIFSNSIDVNYFTNGILYYDISDHLPIFTISNHSETVQNVKNTTPKLHRRETKENIDLLNSDLAQEGWQDVLLESDSDKAYDIFLNKLVYYYNRNIPFT